MKYADQPDKFMDSEVDLDEDVRRLQAIAGNPELYPELIRLNAIPSLLNLLSHENADIAGDVVELLNELTDSDVVEDSVRALLPWLAQPRCPSQRPQATQHPVSRWLMANSGLFCLHARDNPSRMRAQIHTPHMRAYADWLHACHPWLLMAGVALWHYFSTQGPIAQCASNMSRSSCVPCQNGHREYNSL